MMSSLCIMSIEGIHNAEFEPRQRSASTLISAEVSRFRLRKRGSCYRDHDQETEHCRSSGLRRNNSLPDITSIFDDASFWCGRKPAQCKRYSLQRSQSVEWDPVSAIFTATSEDDIIELERILTEFHLDLNFLSPAGLSVLHTAALVGSSEAVKILLEFGAEVDFVDSNGRTTLEVALLAGNFDCASLLINAGASMGNVINGIKNY